MALKAGCAAVICLGACSSEKRQIPAQTEVTESIYRRPNILLIVADDIGYTDLGVYGGEIETPNLDALASAGLQLTNFHVAPSCSPTRSMLFSGTDNHLAGLGAMLEVMQESEPERIGQPGYEGYLNFRVTTLADLLRDAGYHTYMSGKWHLGLEEDTGPAARGFDRSFALIDAGGGHFTEMGLDLNQPKARYREDGKPVPLPKDFYSTRTYTDKLLDYLKEDRNDGEPFFAYLAYTAPHWPLQAPEDSLAKYKGTYDSGYDELLLRRLQRMQALGLIDGELLRQPRLPGEPAWQDLTSEQRRVEARKMELYAAMVDDIDKHVGRVIEYLETAGEFDNTFIFFMSDNGPAGQRLDQYQLIREFMKQCCDNSYENMGKPGSYVFYGPNWARAGAGPLRAHKGFPSEGGVRVPAFAHHPKLASGRSDAFTTVMDLLPTFLEIAGTKHPGTTYKGRNVLPLKGESIMPLLEGKRVEVHADDYAMGWELFGHAAIQQGGWKLLRMRPPYGTGDWQLYNLKKDLGELNDLIAQEPEIRDKLLELWEKYAADGNIILPDWTGLPPSSRTYVETFTMPLKSGVYSPDRTIYLHGAAVT